MLFNVMNSIIVFRNRKNLSIRLVSIFFFFFAGFCCRHLLVDFSYSVFLGIGRVSVSVIVRVIIIMHTRDDDVCNDSVGCR